MNKVVIIGPAHPLRGGLSSFNERLAKEFILQGNEVSIFTFSLQYPSFLFPGTTQYSTEPPPEGLAIKVCINSINPLNWIRIGTQLQKQRPDIIVVRYWLPFMGPCLGTILRRVKKNGHTKIVCIADNIIPHEKRPGDKVFTTYFIKPVDAFITMSEKVLRDLQTISNKPVLQVVHPLYDNFGEALPKEQARIKLGIPPGENIILFFGFIRNYKGLDILLEAMKILRLKKTHNPLIKFPKLLIAGEFYENRKKYEELIESLAISDDLILKTDFIPNSDVRYYLSAADFVIQPYRNATQSGVTPLAYYFEKPMLVTNVGGLPAFVRNKKVGIITEPNSEALAEGILTLYELGEQHFLPHLREEKKKYSWQILTSAIENLVL